MFEISKIFSVAIGGAFGAVSRYLLSVLLADILKPFPFPTFFINITGSFLIGFLLILLTDKFQIHENWRFAVIVGFLGAYTTFSTFEMEIFNLISEENYILAFVYILASVIFGLIGVSLGISLAKTLI